MCLRYPIWRPQRATLTPWVKVMGTRRQSTTPMYRPKTFDPPWIDFFTSPCPYYVDHYTKFTLFPMLPKELQMIIWSLVEIEKQILYVSKGTSRRKFGEDFTLDEETKMKLYGPCCTSRYETPAILHTCYDSRMAGLKIHRLAFAAQFAHPVYFNFETDDLWFDTLSTEELFYHSTPGFGVSPKHLLQIRHMTLNHNSLLRMRDLMRVCEQYTGLRRLRIIVPDYVLANRSRSWSYTTHHMEGEKVRRYLRVAVRALRAYTSRHSGRALLGEWEPPEIQVGTEAEWVAFRLSDYDTEEDSMDWAPTAVFPSLDFTPLFGRVDRTGGFRSRTR